MTDGVGEVSRRVIRLALQNLGRSGEARLYFERVVSEFPNSEYADKAKRRLDEIKA